MTVGKAAKHEEHITIGGKAGSIEAVLSHPERDSQLPLVVICHPHSLYGGTMQNKVVHTLARSFSELGHVCVRFNFRGVGDSDGEYNGGVGETEDLLRVLKSMGKKFPKKPIWLAGFSFGAYVALRAHKHKAVQRLILVAPPVSIFNLEDYAPRKKPWTVIHGTNDDLIPSEAVRNFVSSIPHPPEVHFLDEASHYFHGKLSDLRRLLHDLFMHPPQPYPV